MMGEVAKPHEQIGLAGVPRIEDAEILFPQQRAIHVVGVQALGAKRDDHNPAVGRGGGVGLRRFDVTLSFRDAAVRCRDHTTRPVLLSSAMTRHSWMATSFDGSIPSSFGLYCGFAALLIAVVRNTRSAHTTGLE